MTNGPCNRKLGVSIEYYNCESNRGKIPNPLTPNHSNSLNDSQCVGDVYVTVVLNLGSDRPRFQVLQCVTKYYGHQGILRRVPTKEVKRGCTHKGEA